MNLISSILQLSASGVPLQNLDEVKVKFMQLQVCYILCFIVLIICRVSHLNILGSTCRL